VKPSTAVKFFTTVVAASDEARDNKKTGMNSWDNFIRKFAVG
jgi:hypothetical protein